MFLRITLALIAPLVLPIGLASPSTVEDPFREAIERFSPRARFQADCNHNGVEDSVDIAFGTSSDVNGNGVPDECEVDAVP